MESFHGELRDELLNVEIFDTLSEAQELPEQRLREHSAVRPHSALGYRPAGTGGVVLAGNEGADRGSSGACGA